MPRRQSSNLPALLKVIAAHLGRDAKKAVLQPLRCSRCRNPPGSGHAEKAVHTNLRAEGSVVKKNSVSQKRNLQLRKVGSVLTRGRVQLLFPVHRDINHRVVFRKRFLGPKSKAQYRNYRKPLPRDRAGRLESAGAKMAHCARQGCAA